MQTEWLFLGTGAADWPALEPDTPFPQPDTYRRNASLLVDGHILIDGGPFVLESLRAFGLDPAAITDVFITHSHDDHYVPEVITALAAFARPAPLQLWYPSEAPLMLTEYAGLVLHPMLPGDQAHTGGFCVEALASNHHLSDSRETPLFYIFESAGGRWLYATDGSSLPVSSWKRLLLGVPLDAAIIEMTFGDVYDVPYLLEHNTLPIVREVVRIMRGNGVLKPGAPLYLTHLASMTHLPPAQFAPKALAEGWIAAVDGLQATISPLGADS